MRAGQLRHVVEIQLADQVFDEHGEVVSLPATVATVRARVTPLIGREAMEAGQVKSRMSHRISMRYFPGLTTKHRILHEGRVLNIVSAADVDGRRRETEVMALEEGL